MGVKVKTSNPLSQGKEAQIFNESPTEAGTMTEYISVDADTVLFSLQASVITGTLKVNVYTEGGDGATVKTIDFPILSSPTVDLLLRKASATMQRVKVEVIYTGACSFIIRARGTATGEASFKILGANDLVTSQFTVTTTVGPVITASLTDRATVVIKNYNLSSGTLFIGGTALQATVAEGYPVGPQESFVVDVQAGQEIYGVADAGTIDVRIAETGG